MTADRVISDASAAEDPLLLAMEGSDREWFEATGNCGRCGSPVLDTPSPASCTCTDCGCGPHPPYELGRARVPHDQPDLFGETP